MKKWLFAVLLGSALVLGACGGGDDNADNGNTANNGGETASAGEQAYEANCASCHGADLAGGAGPALDKAGASYSADEIVEIIQNGIGGMPAQKQVSDEDAQEIADWLAAKQ